MTEPPDLSVELALAVQAAMAAGAIVAERYERLERIVHKSEKDVVTEADHLSEEAIIGLLRQAFPGDAFLAEESGHSAPATKGPDRALPTSDPRPAPERLWIIDPLDGTVNYANGIPIFAISIGLALAGEPAVGVVLDPLRRELFTATSGRGAWLDGEPIRHPAKERLVDAVVSLALPASGFARQETRVRRAARVTRSLGSATLALAYVANGRFDAFIQWGGLSAWDIAAAGLIAQEAGARVSARDGSEWFDLSRPPRSTGTVAAAPAHHAHLLELIARPSR